MHQSTLINPYLFTYNFVKISIPPKPYGRLIVHIAYPLHRPLFNLVLSIAQNISFTIA